MRDRRERDAVGRLGAAPFRRHEQTDTKMRVTVERETLLGDSMLSPFGRHEQTDTKMRVTVMRETQLGDSVLPPSGGMNRRTRRCA